MVTKATEKAIVIAILNDEQVAFRTRKSYASALEGYIEDMVIEYRQNPTPQSLKDFIIECVSYLEDEHIEIIEKIRRIVKHVYV